MNREENIRTELLELAPLLAKLDRRMPYSVPEGYFDMLPGELLFRASAPASEQQVPEGYFENFADRMLALARAQSADSAASESYPLITQAGRRPVQTVPPDYFEQFPEKMLSLARAQQDAEETYPLTEAAGRMPVQTIPDGYFRNFPERMLQLAQQQDTVPDELPAVLAETDRRPVQQVPEGYFEDFPERMLEIAHRREEVPAAPAPVRSIRTWTRYAAAAAATLLIGLAAWLYRPAGTPKMIDVAGVEFEQQLQQLDDRALVDFLEENSATGITVRFQQLQHDRVEELLQELPTETIQDFFIKEPLLNREPGATPYSSSHM